MTLHYHYTEKIYCLKCGVKQLPKVGVGQATQRFTAHRKNCPYRNCKGDPRDCRLWQSTGIFGGLHLILEIWGGSVENGNGKVNGEQMGMAGRGGTLRSTEQVSGQPGLLALSSAAQQGSRRGKKPVVQNLHMVTRLRWPQKTWGGLDSWLLHTFKIIINNYIFKIT